MKGVVRPLTDTERAELTRWFTQLQVAIETDDYASAREGYSEDFFQFGSLEPHLMQGLDQVQRLQWERMWPGMKSFHFSFGSMTGITSLDGLFAVVAIEAFASGAAFQGSLRRMTYAFCRATVGAPWLAVHAHFSVPLTPPPPTSKVEKTVLG